MTLPNELVENPEVSIKALVVYAKMQKEIDMLTRAIAEQEKSKSIIMD